MEQLRLEGLTPHAMEQVEAALIMLGFHPAGVEMQSRGGIILLHDDRLFCTCCGEKVDRLAWRTFHGQCHICFNNVCRHIRSAEEFLKDHNKLGLIIEAVTH